MKLVIVLACLLVVAYANEEADIIKLDSEVNVDSYKYIEELSNGIKINQEGQLKDKDNWLVSGSYEYVSKDGKQIKVIYTADEYGYHPKVEAH